MATLNLKSISTLVSNQAAAIQASATALIDFSVGSVLLAVAEANAAVGMWLQGLVLTVLQVSRLATSTGTDVDSFVNDFGLYRLGSSGSNGSVTFSRYTNTQSAFIPVGAQVQSADGTQTFNVIADATNPNFSVALNGFLIPASVSSLTCLVSSTNAGTATNVVAGAVNRLLTTISGVDYVNNAAAMAGGSNAESDSALKVRFVLYLLSLRASTAGAIGYAITSLQLGMQYTLTQNQTYGGASQPGFFYAVVDDGTGSPSSSLLTAAYNAIAPVAGFSITFAVFPPTVVTAAVSGTIVVATGYTATTVKAAVAAAWTQYISALGLGNALNYIALASVATAIPGVVTVDSLLINGATADLPANNQITYKPGTVSAN